MKRLGLIALAAAALLPSAANADPLVVRGDRLFVTAEVNGHQVEALLDSAAELSFADKGAAQQLGLGTGEDVTARGSGGNQRAYVAPAADISAIGIKLKGVPVGVTDLGDISARLIGKRVIFILGHDFFAASRLSIDIEGGTIEQFASGATPVGVELSVTDHDGISSIPVEVGGLKAMADFDLGNGTGVLISKSFAERLRLPVVGLEPAGGIGGSKLRKVVFLPSLTIAGKRFEHVRCRVDPQNNAGDLNIGVGLLRYFLIVTDFGAGKVWLSQH